MNRATGINSTSDVDFGLGGLLALLALPGAFSSILLMDKYSSLLQYLRGQPHFNPYTACLPDEYFFIVYSMAITGLITLLRWDQLLPDARDFANLGTLSLSLRRIFLANVLALATLAALFSIDINLVASFVFPVLVTIQGNDTGALVQVMTAHIAATLGISAFTFLAVIALQGLLMAALPHKLYRRVALTLRTALLIVLTGMLISVFVVSLPLLQVNYSAVHAARWWPPLWFLSLFESHITALHNRSSDGGSFAWRALACAAVLTVCGFSLSYKRYFLKIPERQTDLSKRGEGGWLPFQSGLSIFRPILTPGLETACFQFIFRTLARSETHLLFAGLFAGVGLLLTMQGWQQNATPLTFALFSLGGIRFVFDISSTTNANWAFRLIASEEHAQDGLDAGFAAQNLAKFSFRAAANIRALCASHETTLVRSACRKLLLMAGFLPLLAVWFPVAAEETGLHNAAIYLWFHVLSISILVELLLWKFQKVPFTCTMISSRDRFLKAAIGVLILLLVVFPALARIEVLVVEHLYALPVFIGVQMAALVWLYRNGEGESDALVFQESGSEAFVLLRLNGE